MARNSEKRQILLRVKIAIDKIQFNGKKTTTMDDILLAVVDAIMNRPEDTITKQLRNRKAHPGLEDRD